MKKMKIMIPLVAASMGIGAFMYSYSQKHPIKTQRAMNDMKDMIKDLK